MSRDKTKARIIADRVLIVGFGLCLILLVFSLSLTVSIAQTSWTIKPVWEPLFMIGWYGAGATGALWIVSGLVRRKAALRILGRLLTVFVALTVPIFLSLGSVHRDPIEAIDIGGETYAVIQTKAFMGPDTFVELGVRVEEGVFTERFAIVASNQPQDFGPPSRHLVLKEGEPYAGQYDADYAHLRLIDGNILVAGTGRDCVEVAFDLKSEEELENVELAERFGSCD